MAWRKTVSLNQEVKELHFCRNKKLLGAPGLTTGSDRTLRTGLLASLRTERLRDGEFFRVFPCLKDCQVLLRHLQSRLAQVFWDGMWCHTWVITWWSWTPAARAVPLARSWRSAVRVVEYGWNTMAAQLNGQGPVSRLRDALDSFFKKESTRKNRLMSFNISLVSLLLRAMAST